MCDPYRMDISDDIFEVERILAAKKKDGKLFFKVRWEGYGSEEDSWEPRDNLLSCQELVETFWLEQKKLSVKKRGRKSRFMKEGSDGSDTEDNGQKEIYPNKDTMVFSPTKRKRGRPSKSHSSDPEKAKQRLLDRNAVPSPPHNKDSNLIGKKKRGRPAKKSLYEDEEILSRFSQSDYLLLDLDEIAPLGLTRQASKELALVSLRKKHESELWTNENAEVRKNVEPSVSDTYRKTSEDQSNPMNDSSNNNNESWINSSKSVSSAGDDHSAGSNTFEIIEISSQSTVEDDRYFDGDWSQDCGDGVEECIVISSHSESDGEGESLPAGSSMKSRKNLKKTSTQTPSLICKTKNSDAISNHGKTASEMSEPTDFVPCSNRAQKSGSSHVNIIVPKTSESETGKCLGNSFAAIATDSLSFNDNLPSRQASLVNSTVRTSPVVCQLTRELGVSSSLPDRTAPRVNLAQRKKGHEYKQQLEFKEPNESKTKAVAKRPGDLWSSRKRIAHVPRENLRNVAITSAKPNLPSLNPEHPASHSMNVFINDRITPAKTADLLPLQNKPGSPSLMDGDLIGSIIQDYGHDDQTRKPQSKDRNARGGGGKQDDNERLRQWDSGMEDISEGEDDLSDFEFDLDDYSPHSFFNDVEEVSVPDRGPSPVVEPLTISSADLKQAIRESDDMVVRRVLSVPGFDLEAVDSISGMTLLMWAAAAGQDDIVRLLLRRGANLNTAQRGNAMTSLMHAAEQGFPETVQILLESGANINQLQTAGETALMKACKKGHEKVVEVLLKHGVDTKVQSNFDHTAAQFALRNQHFAIHNMLLEHEKSLAATLEVAIGKCLGGAGTLRPPLLMPYRCIAPGEEDKMTFLFKYNPSKAPQGTRVVLFCVKADFLDYEVSLSFSGDNGVRSVILNGVMQYPLVQGRRSVYLLNPESETNDLTIATHRTNSRLVVCVANVNAQTDS